MLKRWVNPVRLQSQRAANVALVAAFSVLIILPAWGMYRDLLSLPRDELVAIATSPMWKVSRGFPGAFEHFFDERFGYRRTLLGWQHDIQMGFLNVSTSPRVAVGANGWLYYVPLPAGDDHAIAAPLPPNVLTNWAEMLQARHDWLAERGIPYVVLIAPDKQTVYPEALPRSLRRRASGTSRLDELLTYVREHTTVQVVDVRDDLYNAKSREWLYFQTDSHWNERGAYVAYAALTSALSAQFPALSPVPRDRFLDVAIWACGGDCTRLIGFPERFREASLLLLPYKPRLATASFVVGAHTTHNALHPMAFELPEPELPHAVMFHDSFGGHLVPFLSEHFRRIVFAWERQDYPIFDADLVARECPEIVIQQLVERKLAVYVPNSRTPNDPRCETPQAWTRCSERAE